MNYVKRGPLAMKLAITVLLILIHTIAKSQDGNWDVYLAQFEQGPGSVFLNMDLIKTAPQKELPFVVITGGTFAECSDDGFPKKEEFNKLYEISDNVAGLISSITKSEFAGTWTYRCERLDYIYVYDTLNVRDNLKKLYQSKYPAYKFYLNIRRDLAWDAYLKFLYPNDEILEYMANEKVLSQLRSAGDQLIKPRLIDHWLYFENTKDRDLFIKYAEHEKFKIEGKNFLKDSKLKYQLHISRTDSIGHPFINNLTLGLRNKVKEFNGVYDGWETIVLKE